MLRHVRSTLALAALLALAATVVAGDSSPRAAEAARVWDLEQAMYAGGSGGANLARYLENLDPDYAGWPPQASAPVGRAHLAEAAAASSRNPVALSLREDLVRVHRDGNVALAYYTTHRSTRAGAAVDETFETLHVWVRDGAGDWKLFGAMVRPVAPRQNQSRKNP